MTRKAWLMLRHPENGSSELIVTLLPGFDSTLRNKHMLLIINT
jgi:hypothetical protein